MAIVNESTENMHGTTDRLSKAAHDAVDRMAERGGHAEERIRDVGRRAADRSRETIDTIPQYVERHPYRALGIAAAVGLVVGALLRR
ncbi:MAG: hypothetical protein P8180_12805 [Gammaproteobacteria bacterium]|jgi:ElaB/YqjD/DUF883 family membrane-anchored ribosome-binding protein